MCYTGNRNLNDVADEIYQDMADFHFFDYRDRNLASVKIIRDGDTAFAEFTNYFLAAQRLPDGSLGFSGIITLLPFMFAFYLIPRVELSPRSPWKITCSLG